MKRLLIVLLPLSLAACATAGRPSGQLSSYDRLTPSEGAVRTYVSQRKISPQAPRITRVLVEPARIVPGPKTAWLTPEERTALLREVDAQVCFEISERYDLTYSPADADARVRTLITRVQPTGKFGSAASAAAGFFIPGPLGLRMPGALGGLGGEAEMVDPKGRQLAAVVWNRNATAVGTDNPSLSRLGDALQFVEPFADTVAATMTPKGVKSRRIADADPCAQFGPRFRPEGWAAKFATGLYVPQMSGARAVPGADAAERTPN